MKKYLISTALILCSNALAMKPATKKKSLFITTNPSISAHELKPTLEAMIEAHEQARLLHSTHSYIISKNSVFTVHTEESLKAKL